MESLPNALRTSGVYDGVVIEISDSANAIKVVAIPESWPERRGQGRNAHERSVDSQVVRIVVEISIDDGDTWNSVGSFAALGGESIDESTGLPYTEVSTLFTLNRFRGGGRLVRPVLICREPLTTKIDINEIV